VSARRIAVAGDRKYCVASLHARAKPPWYAFIADLESHRSVVWVAWRPPAQQFLPGCFLCLTAVPKDCNPTVATGFLS